MCYRRLRWSWHGWRLAPIPLGVYYHLSYGHDLRLGNDFRLCDYGERMSAVRDSRTIPSHAHRCDACAVVESAIINGLQHIIGRSH